GDLAAFLEAKPARGLLDSGKIVPTRVLEHDEIELLLAHPGFRAVYESCQTAQVLEHERIWFPSYPYEWPPEMLHAAAELTLELAEKLLAAGVGVKDATPYNVLFRGTEPVFIDVLSFEHRDPDDPTWLPYAQFVRTFALPLMANKYFGLSIEQILTTRRDGLEPEEVYRWLKPLQKIRPPFLSMISIPSWLASRHNQDDTSIYRKRSAGDPEKARFILESLLHGLRRTLRRLRPSAGRQSVWSDYMTTNNNYTAGTFAEKESFVREALDEFSPRRVLDVGSNTGHFSAMAARSGAQVVAIDYDPVVLGDVWRGARESGLDILPLAVNLTRPSPGIGWRNRECPSFLDRARGAFDGVLMLAVIHHMLVTERVPLPDILALAAELTTGMAVIEYIGPEDSMFRRLVRGREELHKDLTEAAFEAACRRHFEIVRSRQIEGTHRRLYLLRKGT
ncbi:MAG TPA: class I SAM-dependent methyltransferase, partial [Bryobacteraceae bacterium]|nr:class I SAM-dependent methyltransferase [Bryobacteraceae bacterium]